MNTRSARVGRGIAAACVSVFVAACSHAMGGGSVPSSAAIALTLAFSVLVCVALAGRRPSLGRLTASVIVSQFLFHGAFSVLGAASPAPATPAGHHHDSLAGLGMDAAAGHAAMPAGMWLAHALAALVTIAALRFGERAFWRIFDLVRLGVLHALGTVPVAVSRPAAASSAPAAESLPGRLTVLLPALGYRGPPALCA